MRYAELNPELPAYLFPTVSTQSQQHQLQSASLASSISLIDDEFGADGIADQDMVDAGEPRLLYSRRTSNANKLIAEGRDFKDIEYFMPNGRSNLTKYGQGKDADNEKVPWYPKKLENGKWTCNHKCKDKTTLVHDLN